MNNIKKLRKTLGLSVTELAAKLNMSQGNLTKIENGQVDLKIEVAEKIAAVLETSVQNLLTNDISSAKGVVELPVLNPETLALPLHSSLPLPAHFIQNNIQKPALFVAEDDTMSPLAAKGALILIEQGDNLSFAEDGLYLIRLEKKMLFRRLQQKLDGNINILCEHPAYPPQPTPPNTITIVGRVRGIFNFQSL